MKKFTVAKLIEELQKQPMDAEVVFSREGEWGGTVKKVMTGFFKEDENMFIGKGEADDFHADKGLTKDSIKYLKRYVVLKQW